MLPRFLLDTKKSQKGPKQHNKLSIITSAKGQSPLQELDVGLQSGPYLLVLCNSEAWHDITEAPREAFEKVDEDLVSELVYGHSKLPILTLYLESCQVPGT